MTLSKFKNILLAVTGITILLTPAFVPAIASADIAGEVCTGTNIPNGTDTLLSPSDATCAGDTTGDTGISNLLTTIIDIFSVIVGVVAVIMIIYGGFRYIISGGDSGNVSGAKNTIIFALVGLIIVALSQVIVHFVLSKVGS
jgi:type IV secretion system pilin